MSLHPDIGEVRAETLRKIGRNVVNFQKMEAMLKALIVHSNLAGPIRELPKIQSVRRKAVSKKSMGKLVDDISTLYGETDHGGIPANVNEAWISMSFKFEEASAISTWRKELRRVVSERNRLIHRMLEKFDPNSLESCRALMSDLDAQKKKCDPEYVRLQEILRSLHEGRQEMAKYIMSDEFSSALKSDLKNA